jgi:hypothetical protein
MSERQKVGLGFLVFIAVLGVIAAIRERSYTPEAPPQAVDPWEKEAESATPECAKLIRQEKALLSRDNALENTQAREFTSREARIEASKASEGQKEIARQRLAEDDTIKETKRDADSDIAYTTIQQKLRKAGCIQ